jgi:chromosome segregation ATPase
VSKTRDGPEQPPTAPHARLDELRRQLAEAAAAQDEAAEQLETADGRVRAYEAERAERRDWVARLRDELSSAQAAAEESAAQLRQAERERADARRVAAQAAETVERARARLADLAP